MRNKFTNLQVTSFGLSIKPSSDLLYIKSHIKISYLHVGLRWRSLLLGSRTISLYAMNVYKIIVIFLLVSLVRGFCFHCYGNLFT